MILSNWVLSHVYGICIKKYYMHVNETYSLSHVSQNYVYMSMYLPAAFKSQLLWAQFQPNSIKGRFSCGVREEIEVPTLQRSCDWRPCPKMERSTKIRLVIQYLYTTSYLYVLYILQLFKIY